MTSEDPKRKDLQDLVDDFTENVQKPAQERFGTRRDFQLSTGAPISPLQTPIDLPEHNFEEDVGFPGTFPYTRGVHASMYRSRLWTMRQYAGFGTARESNKRYRFLLEQGQTGLSVAFDLPTQMGYDSDHPMAAGEVGKVGVAIDSIDDMEVLFDQIPMDKVSTSMTINATASILLSLYTVVAEKQGVSADVLRGTIQNDILKEYIARGTYIYPPEPSLRIICDIFEHCAQHMPRWNTISISGYHIREAGSDAAQEIGFTLANAIAYVDAAISRGLEVDSFAPRLAFFFNVHNNFLEEIAKFRAARRLWARIMRDRFGAKNPRSQMLRFHTQTGGSTLTAQQPLVNVARVTAQALAAVLGGTQSLHTNSYDEALGLPTQQAALLALRTQQVIGHESGLDAFVDPLGGSYAIESLTNELEERANSYIEKIDDMGGMVQAIHKGFPQREILDTAYRAQLATERGAQIVVGVNDFRVDEEDKVPVQKIDSSLEAAQIQRTVKLRGQRDAKSAASARTALAQAAAGDANLMPHIIECVRNRCTLGEISDTLRDEFGRYTETLVI
jgi:methylmalonyl-CoA mutase N-terminal domain/subunit